MKTMNMVVCAGLALGLATMAMGAPDDAKVDLTPHWKAGDTIKFKHQVKRTETKIIGNVPVKKDAEEKKDDGAKGDGAKGDAPKAEPGKGDAAKAEPPKEGAKDDKTTMMRQSWTIDQTATYELRVVSASEAGAMLELELKTIDATADLPQGKATWKNDQPEDDKDQGNAVLQVYKPIVGAVVKITVDPKGNFTEVKGDPRVRLEGSGILVPMVQVMVGPDLVKARWGPALWIKDGRDAVSVGQSWKNTEEVPNRALGKFVYETTNTLKGVKDGMAEIDITGDVKLVATDPSKSAPATLTEHSIKGGAVWDIKAGLVKSLTVTEKTHLDVNAMGIPVARDLDSVTTITRE